jgi:voltage-gated potassium channel
MRSRHLRQTPKALFRNAQVLVRRFRASLLAFVTLLCIGTLSFRTLEPDSGWAEALYKTFALIFFQAEIDLFIQAPPALKAMFFAIPLIGLAVVTDGVVRFGAAVFDLRQRKEEWLVAIASTYRDHIIVCGLGRIGYRVVEELLGWGEEVVGIEHDSEGPFVEKIFQMNVPVLIGDARQEEILEQAGVRHASAIVICTEDDLTNVDIALDARELSPEIKVVMRMFDARLAERVRSGFHIHTAFSTSALAAPVFAAAATRAQISHSFYVDEDEEQMVARMVVKPGSVLEGCTIAQVEQDFDLSVILHKRDTIDQAPCPEVTLRADDCLVVFASREILARLGEMNRGRSGAPQEKVRHLPRHLSKRLFSRKRSPDQCPSSNQKDVH